MQLPVLITKSESFNFLREFWHDNKQTIRTPQELLKRAKEAYAKLSLDERQLFVEDNYIHTRLSTDVFEMQMAADTSWDYDSKIERKSRSTARSKAKYKSKSSLGLSKRSLAKFKPKPAKTQRVGGKLNTGKIRNPGRKIYKD